MRIASRALVTIFLLSLVGCGYAFRGGGTALPPQIKNIYIPIAENNSAEPGLSTVVTEALRDEFERYGVVNVVEELKDADAVLRSRIISVRRTTSSVTSHTDIGLQFDTVLTIAAELKNVTGPTIWRDPSIVVSQEFGSTSDVVVTSSSDFASNTLGAGDLAQLGNREISRGQEEQALQNLAEDAAKKIYTAAVAPDF